MLCPEALRDWPARFHLTAMPRAYTRHSSKCNRPCDYKFNKGRMAQQESRSERGIIQFSEIQALAHWFLILNLNLNLKALCNGLYRYKLFSFLGFLLTHLQLVSAPQEARNNFLSAASGFLPINSCRKMGKWCFIFFMKLLQDLQPYNQSTE